MLNQFKRLSKNAFPKNPSTGWRMNSIFTSNINFRQFLKFPDILNPMQLCLEELSSQIYGMEYASTLN